MLTRSRCALRSALARPQNEGRLAKTVAVPARAKAGGAGGTQFQLIGGARLTPLPIQVAKGFSSMAASLVQQHRRAAWIVQFSLLSVNEAPVGPERLEEVVPWFTPVHWDAVVEERSTMSYCGYPACARGLEGRELEEGQIKIDARLKKITQITRENTMYCSDLCETASRMFKSRLSSEATFFRPIARAYIEEATRGEGGAAQAKYDHSSLGKQSQIAGESRQDARLPPDTYVFDLVQKSFGSLRLNGQARADAAFTPDGHSGTWNGVEESKAAPSVVKPHKRPVVTKGSAVRKKKEEREKGEARNAAPAKAEQERLHNGADTRPLKFEVVERTSFETPQPIEVQYVRATDVEGHPVSLPKPVLPPRKGAKPPSAPHQDDSEEVIEGVLSDDDAESDDGDVGGGIGESKAVGAGDVEQWVWEPTEPDAQDADADDDASGPSVVEKDFFMQLWTTLSEWITPESHVFVGRLAAGEDVGAVAADLQSSGDACKRRSDVMVLRREGALGDMLARHCKPAVEALGLVHISHAEVSKRMLGLVSTFDLARTPTPAFFTNRHYKALALVLLGVTFDVDKGEEPRGPETSAPQGSVRDGGGQRPADALLTKLGLQSYEYASLMRDFTR